MLHRQKEENCMQIRLYFELSSRLPIVVVTAIRLCCGHGVCEVSWKYVASLLMTLAFDWWKMGRTNLHGWVAALHGLIVLSYFGRAPDGARNLQSYFRRSWNLPTYFRRTLTFSVSSCCKPGCIGNWIASAQFKYLRNPWELRNVHIKKQFSLINSYNSYSKTKTRKLIFRKICS
jgi:hypothetical protein